MKAREVIVMESKFNQLCVWTATTLDGYSKEDLEQFFRDEFSCRIKFAEEVVTLPCLEKNEEGGRHDLFFYVHDDDIGRFAVKRLLYGIRWWEDVLGNGNGYQYSEDTLKKYQKTW